MKELRDISLIKNDIFALLKARAATNAGIDFSGFAEAAKDGKLFAYSSENCLALLTDKGDHYMMKFWTTGSFPDIKADRPVLTEIPVVEENDPAANDIQKGYSGYSNEDLLGLFEENTKSTGLISKKSIGLYAAAEELKKQGFSEVLRRVRFGMDRHFYDGPKIVSEDIRTAVPSDAASVKALFDACYDSLTGCIPTQSELSLCAEKGKLIVYAPEGVIAGAAHFEERISYTELRHLAVYMDYRRSGAAAQLFTAVFSAAGKDIIKLWAGDENFPAIMLYLKSGMRKDGFTSLVLQK